MAKAHLKLVRPVTVKRKVTFRRLPNAKLRTRGYMAEAGVERQGYSEFERGLNVSQCGN